MSKNSRPKLKSPTLNVATGETLFQIDYSWWDEKNMDIKSYLYSRINLGDDVQVDPDMQEVDLVNAKTGEVHRVDGFQYMVQAYFNQMPDDVAARTSLVDAVFYALLANGNQPTSANELSEKVNKPVGVITRTFGGARVYQGIRPILDS